MLARASLPSLKGEDADHVGAGADPSGLFTAYGAYERGGLGQWHPRGQGASASVPAFMGYMAGETVSGGAVSGAPESSGGALPSHSGGDGSHGGGGGGDPGRGGGVAGAVDGFHWHGGRAGDAHHGSHQGHAVAFRGPAAGYVDHAGVGAATGPAGHTGTDAGVRADVGAFQYAQWAGLAGAEGQMAQGLYGAGLSGAMDSMAGESADDSPLQGAFQSALRKQMVRHCPAWGAAPLVGLAHAPL